MNSKKLDSAIIDDILNKMIETVQSSKDQIFEIGEKSRTEYEKIVEELEEVKEQVSEVIEQTDKLTIQSKIARQRLVEVSRNFNKFSEQDILNAYEKAQNIQIELAMLQEKEKQLRKRRDELDRRLLSLKEMIERAEVIVGQITVVLQYLNQDLRQVGDLLEDAKKKQAFGLRIIEAQEEERKRVSREIHDGPAQMLANVLMRSDLIERVFREKGTAEGFQEVQNLKIMVRNALSEVRRIIYDLRPMALDDLGLIPTLRKYLSTIQEYEKDIKINFQNISDVEEKRLPAKFEVALFRLVQESVTNALKHVEAKQIDVKFEVRSNQVNVAIKDDGKGFDVKNVFKEKKESFGLMGMKERVELLNGKMAVHSAPGKGTFIIIQLPTNL
ncbi:histidine kinase [Aeribacillus pallidus]|uniref:Signal transduction histidine-protein kinase/phosphatase DegS n=1 Tax=Aeribacillus pallidus TaxID=33936 RepID=A0A165Z9R0_9BACI|nr:ATP-binding protein [Aeribacillus pallidus]KZN98022.1 histidine kinase [Aeribacillus pallidus]